MPSEVEICNLALYRTGSTVRITSLNETVERTDAVRQAGFLYPLVRDQLLATAPWGFARKSVALATVTDTTFPGWGYVYEYPSDCIQAAAVCDSGGQRSSVYWNDWCGFGGPTINIPKVPYQVGSRASGGSNVIMTDLPSAYLFYLFRQTITNTFTPLFTDALAWKLGAELGMAGQLNPERVNRCLQMYEPTLMRAMAQMMNEAQQDPERDSPSIQARAW